MTTTTASTHRPGVTPAHRTDPLAGAVAAEWTRLWSVRSTWWTVLAGVLLMAASAGQLAIYVANGNTDDDPLNDAGVVAVTDVVIDAVGLTQYAVLALGLLAITGEFTTGTIRTTLQCTPSRGRVLLAKALVTGAVTVVLGLLLGAVGVLVAAPVLGRWGTAPAAGTAGDVVAVAVYLALVGVFALGLAAVLRSAVLTLTVLFATLYIVPLSLREPDIAVLDRIADAFPGEAGRHFLTGDTGPYPAAVGLLLLAGWAAAALLAGRAALRRRDA
ncbi:ABC transporter permease subunit [Micromonospora endolithica]|uniref:ABC transporter permease n=1 Tax=Micromonospora endolithica TaxID=230091 RepID=A0A3A9ZNH9_9ACTN|nr:ABC transporter permease subunit [Micromonospora endolithica]RKN49076.1 ABC transporter permease [Micromonospora endolithica]TWJ23223.1 ABC-2 family transporter [Micromonospora endolithica]